MLNKTANNYHISPARALEIVDKARGEIMKQCPRCCAPTDVGFVDESFAGRGVCNDQSPCVWRKQITEDMLDHDDLVLVADRIQAATARLERMDYRLFKGVSAPPPRWRFHVTVPCDPKIATSQAINVINEAHKRIHMAIIKLMSGGKRIPPRRDELLAKFEDQMGDDAPANDNL